MIKLILFMLCGCLMLMAMVYIQYLIIKSCVELVRGGNDDEENI